MIYRKFIYDNCMQAIESNNDKINNNKEYLYQIDNLFKKSLLKKNQNQSISSLRIKNNKKKELLKSQSFTQKSIEECLKESKERIKAINQKKNMIKLKSIKKELEKKETKEINLKAFFKGKQRRYTVLKHINEYFESNDVTLNEVIENNPFQDKPYNIPGSYDFIHAVKFGNYKYVIDALNKETIHLFSIDYYGQTGYHWAAKLGNINMLDILISFGRHQNQKDFKGRTPLFLAALNNKKDVCSFLLANGGNPFLSDKIGRTPAEVAGSPELREYLRNSMALPFSNPVYKAKMKRILQNRARHLFKEEIKEEDKQSKLNNI